MNTRQMREMSKREHHGTIGVLSGNALVNQDSSIQNLGLDFERFAD
ncbi:hypothetical protein [Rhizobium leguminosarum]|nr:hypothetical protein [Rhizobium leguminosarum]UIJ82399.1 hypothetical protein LZK78_24670 [Rhizobium leguminosarum]